MSSYVIGDSIAFGLHLDGLEAKLQGKLGGSSRINYDGGRSITSPGNQIKQTALESVEADKDYIASAGVIVIVLGMNPQEISFADSQQQLMQKLKSMAPNARYYWVDIGATVSTHVEIWNERNKIIYDNAAPLGYTVISRYKTIFGAGADPLDIKPGQNFPGWESEPGLNGPGNIHGYYSELARAIVTAVSTPAATTSGPTSAASSSKTPVSSYVIGDSIAFGLHLDGLEAKLQGKLGGSSRINYDGGRSITSPGNQIKQTALESVEADKDYIASAGVIVIVLGMNPQEISFADSQQQLMQKLKSMAPNARYYWVDIGATVSTHIEIWNARNKIIYDNAAPLGYTVISRYKAIFGPGADPLNIKPGQNFPGWENEPGLNGPGNIHGYYPELARAIVSATAASAANVANTNTANSSVQSTQSIKAARATRVACKNDAVLTSYVLGDSIAFGLHKDRLALKLQAELGGVSRISYDTGRSIMTPGTQIKKTALESIELDKDYIATANVIIISLGTNQKEDSFADSQKLLMQKLKGIAPNARYYWIDIGATISTQVTGWNARNKIIYDNAANLGYTVISRYKAIFGPTADPLNITPGENFPGWVTESGYGGTGNIHGAYPELTDAILDVMSESVTSPTGSARAGAGSAGCAAGK